MDYRKTLNLPKTDFPMKANLPKLEPGIQGFWKDIDIYRLVSERQAGKPKYILHDGPPFSNGDIHLGHALNKILKDIVVKHKTMQGFDVPFVPGWDNHGLPTEMLAIKTFNLDRHQIPAMELRRKCAETASHFVDVQREQFLRLGVRGNWEHPYLTMDPTYEAVVLDIFAKMVEKGLVYRGLKPVHWCPSCETALAEAEIEYAPHTSPSIYVRFPLLSLPEGVFPEAEALPTSVMIWTTTPWTLPANVAVALHPQFEYVLVKAGEEQFILAKELLKQTAQDLNLKDAEIVASAPGTKLERGLCRHPFLEREVPLVLAEYVTLEQGTGCVHTAPGHGLEDFETGRKYDLPTVQPLDSRGIFGPEGGKFEGMFCSDADSKILEELRERKALLAAADVEHSYPHCWRCKGPVIFRATKQWFIAVGKLGKEALNAVEQTTWVPRWGEERLRSLTETRPDWCISRQRTWGIPIPTFYCEGCEAELLRADIVTHVRDLVAEHGSNVWFERDAAGLLPSGTTCEKCGCTEFAKEQDIFDVWFESGSSHAAVLETRKELCWPADLYLEGTDQYRGWFQMSLWNSLGGRDEKPYRTVLCHGFFLDETGGKMSKSLGNIISPEDICQRHGADLLRLWVSYVDFKSDMPMSENIFSQVEEGYRRLRNTLRFLLANLHDFDPAKDIVPLEKMEEIDRWILHRLSEVGGRVNSAYEGFEFHRVYYALHGFCAVDLSQIYLDSRKDCLYTFAADNPMRRSAQTALYHLAHALVRLAAPILSHTCEEAWEQLANKESLPESVQLAEWPNLSCWADEELGKKWDSLLEIREQVGRALEKAKTEGLIGQPLEAKVVLKPTPEEQELLKSLGEEGLAAFFVVSQVSIEENGAGGVQVARVKGEKCARCWLRLPSVGKNDAHPTLCHRCLEVIEKNLTD
ncbi:MAG: isoleucine--tRNA ligase [Armatimonadetes bacterium]|nr:isoleucine--tRNA ligase [Armatimonadota bacterium]NIM24148.1 isoleucine--tRNA ligase [Armatimonadota bacterium]NIM68007.1 isoleucine--tRNA ligase [Armatimonadota bacterium]NIM76502.1 isoleucine--tRNA ligase [Armatimonadota bacterium]NIN06241.1 isoleucine--tRNA ligase [Armatimonadota bacterium]